MAVTEPPPKVKTDLMEAKAEEPINDTKNTTSSSSSATISTSSTTPAGRERAALLPLDNGLELEDDLNNDPDDPVGVGSSSSKENNTPSSSALAKKPRSESGSNGKTRKREAPAKIELSEKHLYGPFNFKEHRPGGGESSSGTSSSNSSASSSRNPPASAAGGSRQHRLDNPELDSIGEDGLAPPAKKRPKLKVPVVDLMHSPSPPVVDLSDEDAPPDQKEKLELLNNFVDMFPMARRPYLEYKVDELVGKPAAIDRFIGEMLERQGPPEDWPPPAASAAAPVEIKSEQDEVIAGQIHSAENPLPEVQDTGALLAQAAAAIEAEANNRAGGSGEHRTMPAGSNSSEAGGIHSGDPVASTSTTPANELTTPTAGPAPEETEEDKISKKFDSLQEIFPQVETRLV